MTNHIKKTSFIGVDFMHMPSSQTSVSDQYPHLLWTYASWPLLKLPHSSSMKNQQKKQKNLTRKVYVSANSVQNESSTGINVYFICIKYISTIPRMLYILNSFLKYGFCQLFCLWQSSPRLSLLLKLQYCLWQLCVLLHECSQLTTVHVWFYFIFSCLYFSLSWSAGIFDTLKLINLLLENV